MDRVIHFKDFENTIKSMWKAYGFHGVSQLNPNTFHVEFSTASMMSTVIDKGPWLFNHDYIMMQKVKPGIKLEDYSFEANRYGVLL